jgi:glycosyltransferase involved in cell wall biosynthesis
MEEPHLKEILKPGGSGPGDWRHRWLTFVKGVTNRSLFQISNQVFYDAGTAACGILPFLASVARAGTLGLLAGPYIGAFAHAASDRHYSRQVLARLLPSRPDNGGEGSIGCFYDTPQGMLGSLFSSREQLLGCASTDRRCSAVTCHDQDTPQETAVKVFQPVGRFAFAPDPAPPFHMPPFLDLLKYGYESNFTRIHSFTPGPMGLAALGIAHILKLPIRATIHPGLFHFAKSFGDEPSEEAHFWKYVSWYYSRMEQINVPSQWAAGELERRGLPQDKMRVFSRPVDLDRFSPAKRNGYLEKKFPVTRGVYLLYTGWLANERDIFLLREAFTRLRRTSRDVHLICAGEGPMRSELGKGLEGTSVFFTGPLQGEDLALLFASCDLFVSPGTFDLAGDRVLEAQASGLPAVVTDSGCLREHIIPGKTGLVARAGDASSFYQAVEALTLDAPRRQGMGRAARRYMEERNAIADFPENLL